MAAALGDLMYRAASVWKRLVGNTTTTNKFLRQVGDGTNSAAPSWNQVADADLSVTDITTNNASTSAHGFLKKLDGTATHYMGGDGNWTTPAGAGNVTHTGTLTANELVVGNGSADIKVVAATDGQIPIGKSSDGTVTLGTITAGSGVTVTNGAASITLTATGAVTVAVAPQGRVSLTSATPVLKSNVTAATTVYYTPYVGDQVPIYDGTNMTATTFTELSQATTDTTKSPAAAAAYSNYDIFVWSDSGTLRATRGPAWTQAQTFTVTIASPAVFTLTAHGFYEGQPLVFSTTGALPTGLTAGTTYFVIATALTANAFEVSTSVNGSAVNTSGTQSGTHTATQNTTVRGSGAGTTELEYVKGILLNKNAITNGPGADRGTYVGTIRTNSSSQVDMIFVGTGAAGGDASVIGIWNTYNRRLITAANLDNTDSWNYTTATYRIKDNNAANRILVLAGLAEDGLQAVNDTSWSNTSSPVGVECTIGVDGMTAWATASTIGRSVNASTGSVNTMTAHWQGVTSLGLHYYAPLEASTATGTTTWYGDNGGSALVGRSMFYVLTTF